MKTSLTSLIGLGTALLLTAAAPGVVRAQNGSEAKFPRVLIGNSYCFMVRCPDGAQTPQERADQVQEVFAKYLGGNRADFALKKLGKASPAERVQILLNGDVVITVTTQDAKATRFRTAEELAPLWKQSLQKAFDETRASGQGG